MTLSPTRSILIQFNTTISDDYGAELFYEANVSHQQEIDVSVIISDLEIRAEIKNVVDYPVYNIVVVYQDYDNNENQVRSLYGILDSLEEGDEAVITLEHWLSAKEVRTILYGYLTQALNETGLDPTQHRDDWIYSWLDEWLCICPFSGYPKQPFAIYRIPQSIYDQYFSCSVDPEPKMGMTRVGLVELFNIPTNSTKSPNISFGD